MDLGLKLLHDDAVVRDLLRRVCRAGLCTDRLNDGWDWERIDEAGKSARVEKLRCSACRLHDVSALSRGGRGEPAHLFEEVPAGDLHELA